MIELLHELLGLDVDPQELTVSQMSLRAAVVFVVTILTVRVGQKRFFGRSTALDFILAVILGSVESRAINGSAAFFPTLVAGLVLVGLHWLFSWLAFHSRPFGKLVKGRATQVVQDGEVQKGAIRKLLITHDDLVEDLRSFASVSDPGQVREAWLERNGQLSVVGRGRADREVKVLEVRVEEGVQTIRVEIG